MDPVIEIDGLTKWYGNKQAVAGLTLDIPRGAIFALLGENGAGKTTTIRMLTGLLPPDAGWASILGIDPWRDAVRLRLRVGYVPERPKFYDWMTVSEIGWFTSGFHAKGFLSRYRKLTDRFDLDPAARLGHLSKGQYAKVGLSLALASDPQGADPRRADLRPRSAGAARVPGEHGGPGRRGAHHPHLQPSGRRGRAHRQPCRLHGRRPRAADRHARRRQGSAGAAARCYCEGLPPDPSALGYVLQHERGRNQVRSVFSSIPTPTPWPPCGSTPGVLQVQETPLTLEEAYCALLEQKEELP